MIFERKFGEGGLKILVFIGEIRTLKNKSLALCYTFG